MYRDNFRKAGMMVYIEDNEDRDGQFALLENSKGWTVTLHCAEAVGEWDTATGYRDMTGREIDALDGIRAEAEKRGWEV